MGLLQSLGLGYVLYLPVSEVPVGTAGGYGCALPGSRVLELGLMPAIPGAGQALLQPSLERSPSDTEIGFAKCLQF